MARGRGLRVAHPRLYSVALSGLGGVKSESLGRARGVAEAWGDLEAAVRRCVGGDMGVMASKI